MMKADTNLAVDFVARRLPMELIPRRSNLAVRTRLRTLVESRVAPKLFINCVRKGITYNEIAGIERAVDILLEEVILLMSCHL